MSFGFCGDTLGHHMPEPATPYEALASSVGKQRRLVSAAYLKGSIELEREAAVYKSGVGQLVVANAVLRPVPGRREFRPLPENNATIPRNVAIGAVAAVLAHEQEERWEAVGHTYMRALRATSPRWRRMLRRPIPNPVPIENNPVIALTMVDSIRRFRGLEAIDADAAISPEQEMLYLAGRYFRTRIGVSQEELEAHELRSAVGDMIGTQLIAEQLAVLVSHTSLGFLE